MCVLKKSGKFLWKWYILYNSHTYTWLTVYKLENFSDILFLRSSFRSKGATVIWRCLYELTESMIVLKNWYSRNNHTGPGCQKSLKKVEHTKNLRQLIYLNSYCKDMGCPCSTWLPFDVYISCILCTYLLPMLLCLLFVCIELFICDYDLLYLYL